MKGLGTAVIVGFVLVVAGCGGDNSTTFVEQSSSGQAASSSPSAATASASASAAASTGSSPLPSTAATPLTGGLRIIIDSPGGGSPISSPVAVSGTASVDSGTVIAVVLDAGGHELGRGSSTASASKPDWGHYDVTVTFTGPTSGAKGNLKVYGVSPRDGTTPTYFYFINVTFA